MPCETSVACSLVVGDLQRRLAEIAALGAESLVDRTTAGDHQLLRFRSGAATRRRLEGIVAAEAACCPFLDLRLEEGGGYLVLSISSASASGRELAAELAGAFAATPTG
jgi:hypothetical protein